MAFKDSAFGVLSDKQAIQDPGFWDALGHASSFLCMLAGTAKLHPPS
jgi:hypothetical protein